MKKMTIMERLKKRREDRARWKRDNAHKIIMQTRAANTVLYALKVGDLIKEPCIVCGTRRDIQAHHDDYSVPLKVKWLCRAHHIEHHKYLNRLKKGA